MTLDNNKPGVGSQIFKIRFEDDWFRPRRILYDIYKEELTPQDFYKLKYPYMLELLYKLRLDIDGLIQLINPSLQLEIHELRLAKGWMTKVILVLSPEDETGDTYTPREFEKDEPISAIEFLLLPFSNTWKDYSTIEKIDNLIGLLDGVISRLPNYSYWRQRFILDNLSDESVFNKGLKELDDIPNWSLEITQVYIHLIQAKMFLGFTLKEL